MDDFVTLSQARELTGMGTSTLLKMLRGGRVAGARKFGKMWQVPLSWCVKNAVPSGYVSATEAARRAGVSRNAVNLAISEGRLTAMRKAYAETFRWLVCVEDEKWKAFMENSSRGKP